MEVAAPSLLIFLAVAAATAFLFAPVRIQLLRLLRRARWLLAVLLLSYAYAIPGDALWPALGWASPGLVGVQQGVLRITRLVLMLAGLSVLLATTARPRLIYGLYVLAWPLTGFGFDRRAFAVRLGLTLDAVEQAPRSARWLDALREPLPDDDTPVTFTLHAERWQSRDSAVILAGLLLMWVVLA
ncbi:MAG: hypothetical protein A2X71_13320 [Thiobacillus sp. GWE1_62_9]|nr:MAG: hypothetical protein A2X71_13320 [Thiobacillus sp. GWE1_62_9]